MITQWQQTALAAIAAACVVIPALGGMVLVIVQQYQRVAQLWHQVNAPTGTVQQLAATAQRHEAALNGALDARISQAVAAGVTTALAAHMQAAHPPAEGAPHG